MKNETVKPIKYETVIGYTGRQLWTAVCRRSDRYRREAGGQIYIENGDHYAYHASEDFDRNLAIAALTELGALNLSCIERQNLGVW
jgi:hypothetical protein